MPFSERWQRWQWRPAIFCKDGKDGDGTLPFFLKMAKVAVTADGSNYVHDLKFFKMAVTADGMLTLPIVGYIMYVITVYE